MKHLAVFSVVLGVAVLTSGAGAHENIGSVGPGQGIAVSGSDTNPCPGSILLLNYDGSAENGYCWQYGGVVPPDFGAFAEGYESGGGYICGIQLHLTQVGGYTNQRVDLYVYNGDGTNPTSVASMTADVAIPGAIAFWPSISSHDIGIPSTNWLYGSFFVGYWARWPGQACAFYIAADQNGFGGQPRTNVAPGIGYPTGWQDPTIIWGTTMALGIGAYIGGITPTKETTWGSIKRTFD